MSLLSLSSMINVDATIGTLALQDWETSTRINEVASANASRAQHASHRPTFAAAPGQRWDQSNSM
jgi:hypothetical protein